MWGGCPLYDLWVIQVGINIHFLVQVIEYITCMLLPDNMNATPHFAFFQIFNFSFVHSCVTHGHFASKCSQQLLDLGL